MMVNASLDFGSLSIIRHFLFEFLDRVPARCDTSSYPNTNLISILTSVRPASPIVRVIEIPVGLPEIRHVGDP